MSGAPWFERKAVERAARRGRGAYIYEEPDDAMGPGKMPMSSHDEPRTPFFPATNYAKGRGERNGAITAPAAITFPNGGRLEIHGARSSRHRRLLDYILAYCPPAHVSPLYVGFFLVRRDAAAKVYGDRRMYDKIDDLVSDMGDVTIRFRGIGDIKDGEGRLAGGYARFHRGALPEVEASLAAKGYDAGALEEEGAFYVEISRPLLQTYVELGGIQYHAALPVLFDMDCAAAEGLARYGLSHEYLRGAPLHEIFDRIGVPRGGARDRAIAEIRSGRSAKLLGQLGIEIRIRSDKRLGVWYEHKQTPRRALFLESAK